MSEGTIGGYEPPDAVAPPHVAELPASAPRPAAAFTPSESWIDAFEKQCTNLMRESAIEYALAQIRMIRRRAVDPSLAADLVHDVIVDTLTGTLTWTPADKPLLQHLEDSVRWRARNIRKGKVYQVVDTETQAGTRELEMSLARESPASLPAAEVFTREAFAQIRAAVGKVPSVLAYLDALEAGARGRDDIMAIGNLSSRVYRNARARVQRLAVQLDLYSDAMPSARLRILP